MARQNEQQKEPEEDFAEGRTAPDDADDREEGEKENAVRIKPEEDGGVTVELPKRQRKQRREEKAARYTEEVARFREQNEQLNRHVAELTRQLQARQAPPSYQQPAQQPADPYESEIDNIRAEQETIQASLRAGTIQQPAEIERARQRFYQLDSRARDLDRQRIKKELSDELRREMGAREGEHEEAVLKSEFPDVIAHPQAMMFARGEYYRLLAEGKPPYLGTYREALLAAGHRFGLRQQAMPAPSATQQQRYGAVPQQAGAKGTPGNIKLSTTDMKIARARWPEDDDHVAYAKMAALLKDSSEHERQE